MVTNRAQDGGQTGYAPGTDMMPILGHVSRVPALSGGGVGDVEVEGSQDAQDETASALLLLDQLQKDLPATKMEKVQREIGLSCSWGRGSLC